MQRAGDGRPRGGAAMHGGRQPRGNTVGFGQHVHEDREGVERAAASACASSHSACAPLTSPWAALPDDVIGDRLHEEGGPLLVLLANRASRSKSASASVRVIGATEVKYSRSCASSLRRWRCRT